jgi:hypothetical protein
MVGRRVNQKTRSAEKFSKMPRRPWWRACTRSCAPELQSLSRPLVDEAMQSYDEMIRQIESLEEWRN